MWKVSNFEDTNNDLVVREYATLSEALSKAALYSIMDGYATMRVSWSGEGSGQHILVTHLTDTTKEYFR